MASNVPKRMGVLVSSMFLCMMLAPHEICNATRFYYQSNDKFSINSYIFAIEPVPKMITIHRCFWNSSKSSSFIIQNIGRDKIIVISTVFSLQKIISKSVALLPNKRIIFKLHGIFSHVKILNNSSTRAILYAFGKNAKKHFPKKVYNKNKTLRKAFTLGVKDMPNINNGLSAMLFAFWPQNKRNIWEQLHEVLKTLLNEIIEKQICAIINEKVIPIKKYIVELKESLENNMKCNIANQYMDIAQLLIAFEKQFVFPDNLWTNFYVLPYYSSVITMKMNFYIMGIAKPEWFHLSEDQIKLVKQYVNNTLYGYMSIGAIEYVKTMHTVMINEIYNTIYPGQLYNAMMSARSHIALHGLEIIPKWEMAYKNPNSIQNAYIDVISYSNFYGAATPTLFQQATPVNVPAPLTPPLINGLRAKLLTILCYTESTYSRLVGLKLTFEDSSNHFLGEISNYTHIIDLNNKTITKLGVFGDGTVIHSLLFYTYDNAFYCGTEDGGTSMFFSLKGHHIVSLYLVNGNDSYYPGTHEVASIAVAFLQNPLEK